MPLQKPLTITALDGRPLGLGQVSHCTSLIQFEIGGHKELIQFFLIQSPEIPLVLGFPWLTCHNPNIDWSRGVVKGWGTNCCVSALSFCRSTEILEVYPGPLSTFSRRPANLNPDMSSTQGLPFSQFKSATGKRPAFHSEPSQVPQATDALHLPISKTQSIRPPMFPPELSRVPPEYADLKEVFSKSRATSLPPHRPYDCVIDLVPGASPPRGRL